MKQFLRFVSVGIFNSIWGYLLIFGFMYLVHWSPEASNAVGYAIALVTSYVLNRHYTFRSRDSAVLEFPRFVGTCLAAFAANFAMLVLLVRVLDVHPAIAQIAAGAVYVATSYGLNRYFVFRGATG